MNVEERFWSKVDKSDGCWLWAATTHRDGYGQFKLGGTTKLAHRVAYELHVGPIPAGMQLDHVCHQHACVNPDHLRVVTNAANQQNQPGAYSNSKSGIRGVHRLPSGRWRAKAHLSGKTRHLGYYSTPEEAEAVVTAWRRQNMPYSVADCA